MGLCGLLLTPDAWPFIICPSTPGSPPPLPPSFALLLARGTSRRRVSLSRCASSVA